MTEGFSTHRLLEPRGALIAVGLVTVLSLALRIPLLGDVIHEDELGTYYMIAGRSLPDMLDLVHANLEVTPPLYFIVAWCSAKLGDPTMWIRTPALIAGVVTVPLTYLLGSWTVGRAPALIGAALTALSPFLIFYSSEARPYALAVLAVLLSTICLVRGTETGRARWWAGYALASCAAVYLHYTTAFALGAQAMWSIWAQPKVRGVLVLANIAAALAYLPWVGGLLEDLRDPGSTIIDYFQPFGVDAVATDLGRWAIGHPRLPLEVVPGTIAVLLLATGAAIAIGAGLASLDAPGRGLKGRARSWLGLVVVVALATPVGAAVASAIGPSVYYPRNLIVSWPAFALAAGTLLMVLRGPARVIATAMVLAGFAAGDVSLLDPDSRRPDYEGAAEYIQRTGAGNEPIVEVPPAMPVGYSPLEVSLSKTASFSARGHPIQRVPGVVLAGDPLPTAEARTAFRRAADMAPSGDFFVVLRGPAPPFAEFLLPSVTPLLSEIPRRFRRISTARFGGTPGVSVYLYREESGGLKAR